MSAELTTSTGNLWALQGQLFEMLEEREEILTRKAQQGDDFEDEDIILAIETGIARFVETKVSEVTELRATYFALTDAAAVATAEMQRAQNRAMLMLTRAEKLKELIKECMLALEKKRFDSAMGYFLIAGNGGKEPVEITDEALLPDEVCRWEGSITYEAWSSMCALCGLVDALEDWPGVKMRRVPSMSAISEALQKPCPTCEGEAAIDPTLNCSECGNSGKSGVPGAVLKERGTHLRIK